MPFFFRGRSFKMLLFQRLPWIVAAQINRSVLLPSYTKALVSNIFCLTIILQSFNTLMSTLAEWSNLCKRCSLLWPKEGLIRANLSCRGTRWGYSFLISVPTLQPAQNFLDMADLYDIISIIWMCCNFMLSWFPSFLSFKRPHQEAIKQQEGSRKIACLPLPWIKTMLDTFKHS